jgi:flagellar biosynthesis protein FlhF
MRLKTFSANTLAEAQAKLRTALGDDAIIVATEDAGEGKGVRIVAAVESRNEESFFGLEGLPVSSAEEKLSAALDRHGVPEPIMARLVGTVTALGLEGEDPVMALAAALDDRYRFAPLSDRVYERPVVLIGPPGAGKTVTVAKLAAQTTLAGRTPRLATADVVRAGGAAQLAAFAKILKVAFAETPDERALAAFVAGSAPDSSVIVDTPAINPFDPYDMARVADVVESVAGEAVLVLAAGGDAVETGETAAAVAEIGIGRMIATRCDVTRRLGGVVAAAEQGRLHFADAGVAPQIAGGLAPFTPLSLARLLLQETPFRAAREASPALSEVE